MIRTTASSEKKPSAENKRGQRAWRSRYWLLYTLLFLLVAFCTFFPFYLTGKSFVYKIDGQSQYIVYLRYMGQYLREGFRNLLHGELTPVMYDFSIGLGDDINAIVRFHPLDFLSFFVPSAYTELLYGVILVLRYYLAGLSFSVFAFYWDGKTGSDGKEKIRIDQINVLTGSMAYVFSGYMMIRVMNHPIYAAPFIILPLFLLGAEHVLLGKEYVLFPLVTALGFISNYYFMYISTIALVPYVLLRLPAVLRDGKVQGKGPVIRWTLLHALRTGILYLTGLGMSLITILPTILRYMSSYRTQQTSTKQSLWFFADKRRYGAWFVNLIAPYMSSGNGTALNYAVTILPAAALLIFFTRKKFRTLKAVLFLEFLCLMIPAAGFVFAGFNNENNRWMFLITLALSLTLVFMTDTIALAGRRGMPAIALGAGLYTLACAASFALAGINKYHLAALAQLLLVSSVLLILMWKRAGVRLVRLAVLAMTCLSIVTAGYMTYMPGYGNLTKDCIDAGKTLTKYENRGRTVAAELDDDSFYRTDVSGVKGGSENTGIFSGYRGVAMYNSILNTSLIRGLIAEDNIGLDAVTHTQDLDGRYVALSLANVKYYVTSETSMIPYGFSPEPVAQKGSSFVYENETPLSIGYSYDAVIRKSVWERLSPIKKELVQIHAAVIDDETADALPEGEFRELTGPDEQILTENASLPESGDGAVRTKDGYRTTKAGGTITFSYTDKPGYVCILSLKGLTGSKQICPVNFLSWDQFRKTVYLRNQSQVYTIGRTDYLVALPTAQGRLDEGGEASVSLRFRKKTSYRLSGAQFLYVPVSGIKSSLEALNKYSLTDVKLGKNQVTGKVSLKDDRYMTFSIPDAKGWTLTVDGKKTQLSQSNAFYMGALIPAGSHAIRLSYETPGLKTGALISMASLMMWLALCVFCRRRVQRSTDRLTSCR